MTDLPAVSIEYPAWVQRLAAWKRPGLTAEDRMRTAIEVARLNVEHGTGGPFGAAVYALPAGRLVSVGMNLVVALQNSILHAEVVALMMAERRLGSYALTEAGGIAYELATSCDPCAMCLGAIHWSGVSRLTCGATREDVERIHFDEGPVFAASYEYLRARGVVIEHAVCRTEAAAVLQLYQERGGEIYNG
ncbi:MAG: nucleoside deaminase [Gemmatimonadales bacterium]